MFFFNILKITHIVWQKKVLSIPPTFNPEKCFHLFKHCFCVPENSNWMTPLSRSVSPVLSWWKSVTPPFSSKNSSRANRWSRLVNVLRVWESSNGSNKSSVSAGEELYHQGQQSEWLGGFWFLCNFKKKTLTNTILYQMTQITKI